MKVERQKAEGRRRNARSAGSSFILHPSSFALVIALTGGMSSTLAQVVSDPTRPPAGLATGAAEIDEAGDAGGGMMLQSVMISPTHRAAIINGQVVRLGEKYGDAVLVKIAENEVVLRSGSASQVLKLHPAVEKREIQPAPAKGAARKPKSRAGAAKQ